jgi:hypothetical protein
MDVSEFKAWFEGFTEDMSGQPTAKQWKRVKARVKQIDGTPTTERIFIDRYRRPYEPYWPQPYWIGTTSSNVSNMTVTALASDHPGMNARNAFTALGKAEAASMAA